MGGGGAGKAGNVPPRNPPLPAESGAVHGAGRCRQPARVPVPPGDDPPGTKDPAGERRTRLAVGQGGRRQGHGCPPHCHRQWRGGGGRGKASAGRGVLPPPSPQVSQAGRVTKGPGDGHRPPAPAGVGTAGKLGTARPSGHLRVAKGGDRGRGEGGEQEEAPTPPQGNPFSTRPPGRPNPPGPRGNVAWRVPFRAPRPSAAGHPAQCHIVPGGAQ